MIDLLSFNNSFLNLEILAEEAAEIIQAKSKVARFGWSGREPGCELTNRERLAEEIGDLLAVVDILKASTLLPEAHTEKGYNKKLKKLPKYYDYI